MVDQRLSFKKKERPKKNSLALLLTAINENKKNQKKDLFSDLKQKASESFLKQNWPNPKDLKWRHTPFLNWRERSFFSYSDRREKFLSQKELDLVNKIPLPKKGERKKYSQALTSFLNSFQPHSPCSLLVFVNGVYTPSLSSSSPKDFQVLPLSSLLVKNQGKEKKDTFLKDELLLRIQKKIKEEEKEAESFTSLNRALFQEGAVIWIPKEVQTSSLIHIIHLSHNPLVKEESGGKEEKWSPSLDEEGGEDERLFFSLHPKNFVFADSDSKSSVMESYLSFSNTAYFNNNVTHIEVNRGASLHYIRLQKESPRSLHIGRSFCSLKKEASLQSFYLSFGAALSHYSSDFELKEKESHLNARSLYFTQFKGQHMEEHSFLKHKSPLSFSSQLSKGILSGNTELVFHGKVRMDKVAQKSSSNLLNKNLLLEKSAKVHTQPQMEIQPDDVKATHGATVSQFNSEEILYLKSRGLSEEEALFLLIKGFVSDIISGVNHPFEKELQGLLAKEIGEIA